MQALSGGGGRYPCVPLDMHPLEPEAGSNLLFRKLIYRLFTFLINRQYRFFRGVHKLWRSCVPKVHPPRLNLHYAPGSDRTDDYN